MCLLTFATSGKKGCFLEPFPSPHRPRFTTGQYVIDPDMLWKTVAGLKNRAFVKLAVQTVLMVVYVILCVPACLPAPPPQFGRQHRGTEIRNGPDHPSRASPPPNSLRVAPPQGGDGVRRDVVPPHPRGPRGGGRHSGGLRPPHLAPITREPTPMRRWPAPPLGPAPPSPGRTVPHRWGWP